MSAARNWLLLLGRDLVSGNEWFRNAARNTLRAEAEMSIRDAAHALRIKTLALRPSSRRPQIVVSLTSIPPRLDLLHLAIKAIMRQTVPPDRIVLWLSHMHRREKFGDLAEADLPASLRELQCRGLEICWTDDIGSYRKLLPALQRFPDDIIITVDDDIYHRRDAVETLYSAYLRHGDRHVYCRRSRVLERRQRGGADGYAADELNFSSRRNGEPLFSVGAGGVLYPPGTFTREVFNREAFMELVPHEDDCWFNVMAILNGRRAFQVDAKEIALLTSFRDSSLAGFTKDKHRSEFNRQLTNLIRQYGMEL